MKLNRVLNIFSSPNNDYFNTSISKNDKSILDNDYFVNKNKYNIVQNKGKIQDSHFFTVNDNSINKNIAQKCNRKNKYC